MGVGGQRYVAATLPPAKPGTHCIGGWVGPRAGLDPISITSILISYSPLRLGLSCGLPHQNTVCISHLSHTYHVPDLRVYFFFSFLWGFDPTLGHGLPFRGLASTHWIHKTSLDEGSARRRDLYLTTHNTHNRQTSMPPARFEPTVPASERRQTHAIDRAASGTGTPFILST